MITAETLQAAWEHIESKNPQAHTGSFLQKSLTDGDVGLSAVIRVSDAMPGLLLRFPETALPIKWSSRQLSGVRFDPLLKVEGGVGLPLMLADSKAKDIFAQLAADLATAISKESTAEAQIAALFSRLSLWRRFLQNRTGKLSDEEVRGLTGELHFLGRLIQRNGIDGSLESWKGPRGELHDFHLPGFRIEVKTWSNQSVPRVFISDPSQIIVDNSWPLWLAAVELTKNELTGSTLSNLVACLASPMDCTQREVFSSLLSDYGYLDAHAELYPERYSIQGETFYQITDSFPRIDLQAIPAAITSVKYAIDLTAIAAFSKISPLT